MSAPAALRRAQLADIARRRDRGDAISDDDARIASEALADLDAAEAEQPRRVVARRVADIRREPLRWLWPGRIPQGKPTLLVGDPGVSKSLLSSGVAATVSRGGHWPIRGEGKAPLGDVILISAEDDAADTIRPRLEAAGADLSRVHILDCIEEATEHGEQVKRPWNLADLPELERLLDRLPGCRLIVIDPISAYLAGTDSHNNADVRTRLAPVADLAARRHIAVLVVSHLNKSQGPAMYRTTGSLAFVAAARAVYAVVRDKDDSGRRLMVPIKANLAPDSTGVAYRIGADDTGTPRLEWEPEPVAVTAEEALAALATSDDGERTERQDAAEWLRSLLQEGPKRIKEIMAEARGSFSERTLQRARCDIGAKVIREGFGGECRWTIPAKAAKSPCPENAGKYGDIGENAENRGFQDTSPDHTCHTRQGGETGGNGDYEGEL